MFEKEGKENDLEVNNKHCTMNIFINDLERGDYFNGKENKYFQTCDMSVIC